MHARTYRLVGELVLVAGLLGFVLGALALVTGYLPNVPAAALGALALLFVGTGSAMKRRGRVTD
ncbi:hypothetical protein [Halorarius litoreus]|uniref:hypothetical protein n=1 Tax=Halorarius litoreus TaxID=2962676 RepID=UPI0020CDFF23|nr:hypothetical protein [Halorarius litoreus]